MNPVLKSAGGLGRARNQYNNNNSGFSGRYDPKREEEAQLCRMAVCVFAIVIIFVIMIVSANMNS